MALAWMVKRESGRQEPCGGILADDQVRPLDDNDDEVFLSFHL